MHRSRLILLFFGLIALAGASRGHAQLIEVRAGGTLEHLVNAPAAPAFLPGTFLLSYSLPSEQRAVFSPDGQTATFRAVAAEILVSGEQFQFTSAEFVVERYLEGPFATQTGYLLRGETAAGWSFTLLQASSSPDYAPDFSLPRSLPAGFADIGHDATISDQQGRWSAYGDALFLSVELMAVPEPQAFGAAAALTLIAVMAHRRWRPFGGRC